MPGSLAQTATFIAKKHFVMLVLAIARLMKYVFFR
jgi:hypothetical protein